MIWNNLPIPLFPGLFSTSVLSELETFFWFWNLCWVTNSQDRAFQQSETDVLVTFTATSSMNGQRCQFPWAAAGACYQTGLWEGSPADWLQLRDHTASSISSMGQVCQQSGQLMLEGCLGLSIGALTGTFWAAEDGIFWLILVLTACSNNVQAPLKTSHTLSAHVPSLLVLQIGSPISFNIQPACDQKSSQK